MLRESLGKVCKTSVLPRDVGHWCKENSLSEGGYERKTQRTRKRGFFDEMNLVVP